MATQPQPIRTSPTPASPEEEKPSDRKVLMAIDTLSRAEAMEDDPILNKIIEACIEYRKKAGVLWRIIGQMR